jgi:hypothetical protein
LLLLHLLLLFVLPLFVPSCITCPKWLNLLLLLLLLLLVLPPEDVACLLLCQHCRLGAGWDRPGPFPSCPLLLAVTVLLLLVCKRLVCALCCNCQLGEAGCEPH